MSTPSRGLPRASQKGSQMPGFRRKQGTQSQHRNPRSIFAPTSMREQVEQLEKQVVRSYAIDGGPLQVPGADAVTSESHELQHPILPKNLLRLPQEIQDLIFDYAYPDDEATFTSKENFEREEMQKSIADAAYQTRAFKHQVDQFLVSKRYFLAAAPVYVGNRIYEPTEIGPGGIFHAYATRMCVEAGEIVHASFFCRLQHIEMTLSPGKLGADPPSLEVKVKMDDTQVRKTLMFDYGRYVRGLQTFKAKAGHDTVFGADDPRGTIWESNLRKLETVLGSVITQPKVIDPEVQARIAELEARGLSLKLYEGSRVFMDSIDLSIGFRRIPEFYAYGSPRLLALKKVEALSKSTENGSVRGNALKSEWPVISKDATFNFAVPSPVGPKVGEKSSPAKVFMQDEPRQKTVDPGNAPIDIAVVTVDMLLKCAELSPATPASLPESIPDTDKELLEMIVANPIGMIAWIRNAEEQKKKLSETKAQMVSISETLGKLGLD